MAVLVVHREGSDRAACVEALRREGFDVRPTANPFRAVSELAGQRADCVVLDLGPLGEKDLEVVPVLKDLAPGVPVILTFPPSKRELAARGLTLGADVYLPEPYYMEELIALVTRATTRRVIVEAAAPPPDDLLQQLAADAAHEINNPLQVIQLLYDGESGRMRPARSKIQPQLGRIGAVGRLLAELGQLPAEKPTPDVDVAALLEDARTGVPQAGEDPVDAVSPVPGYPEFLGAVLEGLLRRAVRGEDPVRSGCRDVSVGQTACVEVVVEGAGGIVAERSPPGEDPALGPLFLTVARIVAHRHGGVLETREEPAEGVRYRLLLPVRDAGRGADADSASPDRRRPNPG
jgi:DNA-binding response OmpR family regulator